MKYKENSKHVDRVKLFAVTVVMVAGIFLSGCEEEVKEKYADQDIANAWADMSLFITRNTPSNSPTFASRCFGYIGVTMYESVVHGYPDYVSLVGQLNGLDKLPLPQEN